MKSKKDNQAPSGANIAGIPIEEGGITPAEIPASDGNEPYIPRHLAPDDSTGEFITRPDGSHIAANGAVIREPWSEKPEITPDNEYTEEKEDLNLLIM